jgi:cytochrome P450
VDRLALRDPPSRRSAHTKGNPDGHEGWIVTGYDAVRQLMADTRFSSRQDIGILHEPYEIPGMPAFTEPSPQQPGVFIAMDPPDHTRLRRKLIGAFTVKRMKMLEEHIIDIAERQLDELARLPPPVDLVKEFALPVPSLVICELLGVPYADRENFQVNTARFLNTDLPFEEKIAAYTELSTYLAELVTSERAAPGDDILSDLARHDDLTIEELTGIALSGPATGPHRDARRIRRPAASLPDPRARHPPPAK